MKYYVSYIVTCKYTAEVEADSVDEARELAEEEYYAADFGELSDIGEYNTKQKMVEDERGEIVWEG